MMLFMMMLTTMTAWAADETKTFENATIQKGNTGQLTYNGEILFSAVGNETVKKSTSSGQVTLLPPINDAGEVEEGTVRFYPRISGKVKSIVFSSAYTTTAGGYVKFGKGSTWTNPVSETMTGNNAWTSISFTNSDGIQLDNEGDYLEIKLFGTAQDGGGIISKGSITVTYEPTSSVQTHTHNFSYSQNGSTLTATCAHNDGKDCSLASDNWQVSTTLTPPTNAAYEQYRYHPATLSNIALFTTETGAAVGDITYVNNTTGASLGTSSPHDVGAYTASVTITAGGTGYTLTTSYSVGTFCGINTNYPQFTTDKEGNYSIDGETVTLTFTSLYGETLTGLTVTGATTNYSIGSGITDNGNNTYTFTMPQEEVSIGATFTAPDASHFEQNGDTYTIKTANGWGWFCFATNYDLAPDGFSGKNVKLDADVSSSEMAGTSGHPFKGTFDGQGNTLTFNRTAAEDFCAPFHYINGATISNLHVQGTITGGNYERSGGLVGHSEGNITINNCRVSTEISTTVSGVAFHGGVIAFWYDSNVACTVTGCVYDGLIYNPNEADATTYCSGFIGNLFGSNLIVTFTDCLFAPAAYGTGKYTLGGNCFTFVYPNSDPTYNMTNCYYTSTLGNRQGRPAATATVAPANLGNETTDHGMVDGYENGFLYNGNYYTPKYGDAVVEYRFNEWNERADVTINGTNDDQTGVNVVGVNITEEVGNIKSVTYNRPFTAAQAATVILPFNYICNGSEGGKFYEFVGVSGSSSVMEDGNQVTSLTANTPYIFMPTATAMSFPNIENMTGGAVTLKPTAGDHEVTSGSWKLVGSYTSKTWAAEDPEIRKAYFINNEGALEKIEPGMTTLPTSCYLLKESENFTIYDSGSDAENNTTAIETAAASGKTYDVTLAGRTLFKDGKWNTLCLPFALSAEQIAAHADFSGATLMELDTDGKNGFDPTDGTLYLTFKAATAIAAGVPYLVKWDAAGTDFTSPTFSGVTINATATTTVSDADGDLQEVQMVGSYSPVPVVADDKSILFLGEANTLYYSSIDRDIRSCRAYFSVPYIKQNAGAKARAFVLNFDGEEATGILEVSADFDEKKDDTWYSLDGVRLNGKPTQRGLYINNGKKTLIK